MHRLIGEAAGRSRVRYFAYGTAALAAAVALQLAFGVAGAAAHQWGNYHWNRGGSKVDIYINDSTGGCTTSGAGTNDALYDIYYNPHPIYTYCVGYHTDISLLQEYAPSASWNGYADPCASTCPDAKGHFSHVHVVRNSARTQSATGRLTGKLWQQGIWCQEFGHALGLQHADNSTCMSGSYFASGYASGVYYWGSTGAYTFDWDHFSSELYNMYRWHTPH
jgi:hypothetical protein